MLSIPAHSCAAQSLTTRSAAARLVLWLAWFKIKIVLFMVSLLSSPLLRQSAEGSPAKFMTLMCQNVPPCGLLYKLFTGIGYW